MRTFGLTTTVMLVICLVGWVGVADNNIESKQFVVRMMLTEEGKDPGDAAHPLASPMLMILADSPACVEATCKHGFHGRTLLLGKIFNLTVHSLDDKHVVLDGNLEISDLSDTSDDIVYRTSNSLHFHRRVELGKADKIKLKGPGGSPQVLTLRADSCDSQVPEERE